MVSSTTAVAGWKPRVADCLRKASRRSRSAAEANPHHACDAYDNLETTVAWKIVGRAPVGRPWCRRVRSANNDCTHDTLTDHSCIMLLYYGTVFPSSFVNQRLINPATIKPAPLSLYLRLFFMRNSKHFSSTYHSPLSLYALPLYVSSLVSWPGNVLHLIAIFIVIIHRHIIHIVSENKPPSDIAVLVGFYRQHSKSPHLFSFIFHSICGGNYYYYLLLYWLYIYYIYSRLKLTERSFMHHASVLWNSLPKQLRQPMPHQPSNNQTGSTLALSSSLFHAKLFNRSFPP